MNPWRSFVKSILACLWSWYNLNEFDNRTFLSFFQAFVPHRDLSKKECLEFLSKWAVTVHVLGWPQEFRFIHVDLEKTEVSYVDRDNFFRNPNWPNRNIICRYLLFKDDVRIARRSKNPTSSKIFHEKEMEFISTIPIASDWKKLKIHSHWI